MVSYVVYRLGPGDWCGVIRFLNRGTIPYALITNEVTERILLRN